MPMSTFVQYRVCYGSVRITEELNEAGYVCCVNYMSDIMREKCVKAETQAMTQVRARLVSGPDELK